MSKNTEYRMARIQRLRNEWFAANGPCQKCGSSERLEVDHIDPATKDPLTRRQPFWHWSKERREIELAKCQVLCYSCHKVKTREDSRKEACPKGHLMTPENIFIKPRKPNVHLCRRCEYDAVNKFRKNQKLRSKAAHNLITSPVFVEFS